MTEALTNLPANGDCIQLMGSTYIMMTANGIEVPKDNIRISGHGKDSVNKLANGENADASIYRASNISNIFEYKI
jgi:hypothetical protein